jgi:hypothetical protein
MGKIQLPLDAPGWARTLADELNQMDASVNESRMRDRLNESLKDVPKIFWHRRSMPTSEEEYEAFVNEAKADYAEFGPTVTKSTTNPPVSKVVKDFIAHQGQNGSTTGAQPPSNKVPQFIQDWAKKQAENVEKPKSDLAPDVNPAPKNYYITSK